MKAGLLRGSRTGAAWLSSVRAVRCLVKSTNERNPYEPLPAGDAGNSAHTARLRGRKVGMTSSQYGPYTQGCTRATMAHTEGRKAARLKLKEIDGGPHKQRSMWLNSMQREEPYLDLTYSCTAYESRPPSRVLYRCCMAVVSSCREVFG